MSVKSYVWTLSRYFTNNNGGTYRSGEGLINDPGSKLRLGREKGKGKPDNSKHSQEK